MSVQSYPVPRMASLLVNHVSSNTSSISTFIMSDWIYNLQDCSCWWVVDEISRDLLFEVFISQWWSKSDNDGGDNIWTKVPHSDDAWVEWGASDWDDEEITNNEVANVSAPVCFATASVSFCSLRNWLQRFGVTIRLRNFIVITTITSVFSIGTNKTNVFRITFWHVLTSL